MNLNPMQIIQLIKQGGNPQQIVMSFLGQQGNNNPILQNAAALAKGGNIQALEQIARNLAAQRGLDFDTEFTNFKQSLK